MMPNKITHTKNTITGVNKSFQPSYAYAAIDHSYVKLDK